MGLPPMTESTAPTSARRTRSSASATTVRVSLTPEQWVEAATELLVDNGIDAVRVDVVSKLLKVTRGPEERYAAVVTLGSRRLDINGAVKAKLEAKRLSYARRFAGSEITE